MPNVTSPAPGFPRALALVLNPAEAGTRWLREVVPGHVVVSRSLCCNDHRVVLSPGPSRDSDLSPRTTARLASSCAPDPRIWHTGWTASPRVPRAAQASDHTSWLDGVFGILGESESTRRPSLVKPLCASCGTSAGARPSSLGCLPSTRASSRSRGRDSCAGTRLSARCGHDSKPSRWHEGVPDFSLSSRVGTRCGLLLRRTA